MYFEMDDAYETGAGRGVNTDCASQSTPPRVPFRPLGLERGHWRERPELAHGAHEPQSAGELPPCAGACATFAAPRQQSNGTLESVKIQADIG